MNNLLSFTIVAFLLGIVAATGCSKKSEPAATSSPPTAQPTAQTTVSPSTSPSVTQSENVAPEVDPHDIPLTEEEIDALKQGLENYTDALTKIKSYRDAIRDEIANGKPLEAHRPLDELDIVLEQLSLVARDNNIPKSEWELINTSAQQIRELFNQVHARIDAREEANFEAVADEIKELLTKLEGVQLEG